MCKKTTFLFYKGLALLLFLSPFVFGQDMLLLTGKQEGMFLEKITNGKVVQSTFVKNVSMFGDSGAVILLAGTRRTGDDYISVFDKKTGDHLFELELDHQPLAWVLGPKQQMVFQDEGKTAYFISYEQDKDPMVFHLEKLDLEQRQVESFQLPTFLNGARLAAVPAGVVLARKGLENMYLIDPVSKAFTVYEPEPAISKTIGQQRIVALNDIGVFEVDEELAVADYLDGMLSSHQAKQGVAADLWVLSFQENENHFLVLAAERNGPKTGLVFTISKADGRTEQLLEIPFQAQRFFTFPDQEMLAWWDREAHALQGFRIQEGQREIIARFGDEILNVYALFN